MPVRFGPVSQLQNHRQILQYRLDEVLYVLVGSDRSFELETPLHWLPEHKRTVPCTHEDCRFCLRAPPDRVGFYLPVLLYSHEKRCWQEKILPLHWGMRDFLELPRDKIVYGFGRTKYKNAPVKWKTHPEYKITVSFLGFDCIPSVMHMWGMYAKLRRTADRLDDDTPKLFDEPGSASAVA
jgi:hypothetical protein